MTSTARRRWSRELESEVDGLALDSEGDVLIHGYDPPAGMMWVDDVIPGKFAALDRHSGEARWISPCEVGYGRGFGAGFDGDALVVVGPSNQGHRIVRMARSDGRLLGVEGIPSFDEAEVHPDLCFCLSAGKVFAVDTRAMSVAWTHKREGERFHLLARAGDRLLVAWSDPSKQFGVLALDVHSGKRLGDVVPAGLPPISALAAAGSDAAILSSDLGQVLPTDAAGQLLVDLAMRDPEGESLRDTSSVLAFRADEGIADQSPLWFEALSSAPLDEAPDSSITANAGKLYLARGALLEARDLVSGRTLGEWTVPGLDERVDWLVRDGAAVLAEERRVSVFELPA